MSIKKKLILTYIIQQHGQSIQPFQLLCRPSFGESRQNLGRKILCMSVVVVVYIKLTRKLGE